MTLRKLAGVLPVLVALVLVHPLAAQGQSGHRWTANRPDAMGPLSLTGDRTLGAGELEFTLKLVNDRFRGIGFGKDSLTLTEALVLFDATPLEMVSQGAEVNLGLGITQRLTLLAKGTFVQKRMEIAIPDPEPTGGYWPSRTESLGPEDVEVSALLKVVDQGPIRAHLHAGVGIPVGLTDFDDMMRDPTDPQDLTTEVVLPYQQQLGSGTWDVLPGFTLNLQNEVASLGLQGRAVIRIGENDRGWALGDRYEWTLWAGYNASDWVSVLTGARYISMGPIEGFDPAFLVGEEMAYNNPAYSPNQAGTRVEIPLGVNVLLPSTGRFGGHRIGVEFLFPVQQELKTYYQMRKDWSVVVGWQKAVSF